MKPAMRRSAALGIVIAALVALIGATVEYRIQTRPDLPPLGAHARRILVFVGADARYWWLNEHEVMLRRGTDPGAMTFIRHNIDNGAEAPLPALTALYRASAGKLDTLHVSPTGDWALWSNDRNTTFVTTLDGRRHDRIQEPGPRRNIWMYTGIGWYAVHVDTDTISLFNERYLDDPHRSNGVNVFANPFPNDPAAVDLDHITPSAQNKVLVPLWTMGKGNLDRADIGVTGLGANPQSVKKIKLPPPYRNSGGQLAISPWSDQLAWRLDILLPAARFWNDLRLGNASRYSVGFWVTDLKTGSSVRFGYLDADRNDPESRPTDLQFSPVGKYVSFVRHRALWVIATE